MLAPGTLIRVEVIGKLPKAFAGEPKIGDLLPSPRTYGGKHWR